MAKLIQSADVYRDSDVSFTPGGEVVIVLDSLPTLYDKGGHFVFIVNSWFYDLKAVYKKKT
ncbi:hypothetical protein XBO1_1880040 [Xenorhabdus bovienii str. oregonense]|uniref:Uncharacterized protein n=1 Tax=Xenorhabdus bovienii str. oregonense TaxID=1398202 RepID=A0A077P2U5_XENBV|nr:hypothetical protein [Xenorhabdus bovienii]CDH05370.1 hypothetical protein XBO1_1880040 [Xenorhabdus bovienii str. oregonense]